MTQYIVELYEKGARRPYSVFKASLRDGYHPSMCNLPDCFNFRLCNVPKVKIKYASNGKVVAEKYMDVNGNSRLRWHRM